ncbi:MAG: hypothetical protein FJ395_11860 [Verrucomicrobia bacterium]|nr:hypothetical protein [Verrucomicrobiota bacterium]
MILIAALAMLATDDALAQRKIVNDSGKPRAIQNLVDSSGQPFARLFMSGKEMVLDANGEPTSGAGYYEAAASNYYYLATTMTCTGGFGGLHVGKVEWDDTGKTTSISGLEPLFEAEKSLKIVSDVKNPKLVDGILSLKFEGKGDVEYKFKIVFGKIISIEPSLREKKTGESKTK